jgi:hypothetical protein
MPRFGNPGVFAIDVEDNSTPESPRGSLWGQIRVWVDGFSLGNYELRHCGLSDFHLGLLEISEILPRLVCPAIETAPPDVAFEFLNSKVYAGDSRSDAQVALDAVAWSRFSFLTNASESFNRLNGFIHCSRTVTARILVREGPPDRIRSVTLPIERFRAVARNFDEWATPRLAT